MLLPPPVRWLRLKNRASSRTNFLLVMLAANGEKSPPEDIKENQFSLKHSFRPLSAYHTSVGGQAPGDYRSRPFVYLYVESGLRDFLENPA
jgi:hypothetical protein